jgi:phospholipase/carboxylesterase
MHTELIGPLRAHLTEDRTGPGPTVVLLHGFGAPGTDLVGLASELRAPPHTRFVFPEAPLTIDVGLPPPYQGRAWWLIDMMRLQVAVMTGSFESLARHVPEGLAHARQLLSEFLDALDARLNLQEGPLVIGGFSQGAMLSSDLVLNGSRNFAGLMLFSGSLIAQDDWSAKLAECKKLPFYQSHGRQDPILPFALAERLHNLLTEQGWSGRFVAFEGGHGISREALDGAGEFLSGVLA